MDDILPPSLADIETLALAALSNLPPIYARAAQAIVIRVEDFPSEDMADEMDLDDPYSLTGLYDGIPLTEKSVMDQQMQPDMIWLFRRPILDEWAERGDIGLSHLVSHVMVHELAHHFGWTDEQIAEIDRWWE
ncbi:metallopeptidase family protein [Neogemmobacter tilapiae]|uniref:Neutral zinc metallopeptidase n=1 Tax=Neogemmobacter tilapiae TaxID=875041 RepID=A0A918TJK7_9RHOB|nr:metallopeptidase family protein [Gemmobacter tilapiae]GHC48663.1 neutral zinc metallopeptidase [Gemmobacter tilapiae]